MTTALINQVPLSQIAATPAPTLRLSNMATPTSTPEQQQRAEYELFQFDVSMTAIMAMASVAESAAIKAADIARLSSQSEWRAHYGIVTDYSKQRDTLSAAQRIYAETAKYDRDFGKLLQQLTLNSYVCQRSGQDAGTDMERRMEVCEVEYKSYFDAMRHELYDMLKPLKCTDPLAFYPMVYALLMAKRFSALSRYVASFVWGFGKGQGIAHMCHLQLQQPLIDLLHRCQFRDKEGNTLLLILDPTEYDSYQHDSQTRKWQHKHKGEQLRPVRIDQMLADDRITRCAWRLESHMFNLKTVDSIIARADGHDPEFSKQYRMRSMLSCTTLFEQAMLNMTYKLNKWDELPNRLADYIKALQEYSDSLSTRRNLQPVVCFCIEPVKDKNGKLRLHRGADGKVQPHTMYRMIGIWNSVGEASREWCTPWLEIHKAIRKRDVDSRGYFWIPLGDYLVLSYRSMLQSHPEVAERMLLKVPGLAAAYEREIALKNKPVTGTKK